MRDAVFAFTFRGWFCRFTRAVFAAVLTAAFALCSFSCAADSRQLLDYQRYPCAWTVKCECDGFTFGAEIALSAPRCGVVTFTSPDTLAGCSVAVGEEEGKRKVTLGSGGLSIPLTLPDEETPEAVLTPWSLVDMFSLTGTDILSVGKEKSGGRLIRVLTVALPASEAVLRIDGESGLPLRVDAVTSRGRATVYISGAQSPDEE